MPARRLGFLNLGTTFQFLFFWRINGLLDSVNYMVGNISDQEPRFFCSFMEHLSFPAVSVSRTRPILVSVRSEPSRTVLVASIRDIGRFL